MAHEQALSRSASRTWGTLAPLFDPVACLVIGAVAGLWAFTMGGQITPWISDYRFLDLWFQGDSPRAFANMTNLQNNPWSRDDLHPLFRLVTYPMTSAVAWLFSLSPEAAVRVVVSGVAGLWASGFYGLLRLMRLQHLEAMTYSFVLLTSAAFVFWSGLPETFLFGSLSLIMSMALLAAAERHRTSPALYVFNNLMTVGFVLTSALAGAATTLLRFCFKKALGIFAVSGGVCFGLWQLHKAIFPVDRATSHEFLLDQAAGPLQILASIFFHTLVMPEIKLTAADHSTPDFAWRMTTQFSDPGTGGLLAQVAVVAWVGMLLLGAWSVVTMRTNVKLRLLLGIVGLGFLGAHLIFGDETFLYALQFAPLLVVLAAFAALGPMRRLSLALAFVFVLSAGIHNASQFQHASEYVRGHSTSKHPIAVWPHGATYVEIVYHGEQAHEAALVPPLAPAMRWERVLPVNFRTRVTLSEFQRNVLRLGRSPAGSR